MKKSPFYLLAVLVLATSCSRYSYFTVGNRSAIESSSQPIKKLQFYIDRDVTLWREVASANAKVASGKVEFKNGKYRNIIYLKRLTPGVCESTSENTLRVSFESGNSHTLEFGPHQFGNKNLFGIYGRDWENGKGIVTYDGFDYHLEYTEGHSKRIYKKGKRSNVASLLIKGKIKQEKKVDERTMEGKRLN